MKGPIALAIAVGFMILQWIYFEWSYGKRYDKMHRYEDPGIDIEREW